MDDHSIIDLYWTRCESAIAQTAEKYGRYCHAIAYRILGSHEDSEECVNDTFIKAWNTIPPERPEHLDAFLGTITRNLSLDRYRKNTAGKRSNGHTLLVLEELQDCIPDGHSGNHLDDALVLADVLNRFLSSLPSQTRRIFLRRYWYFCSVKEIAAEDHITEGKVKMLLLRTRRKLKQDLEKEGVFL